MAVLACGGLCHYCIKTQAPPCREDPLPARGFLWLLLVLPAEFYINDVRLFSLGILQGFLHLEAETGFPPIVLLPAAAPTSIPGKHPFPQHFPSLWPPGGTSTGHAGTPGAWTSPADMGWEGLPAAEDARRG